MSMCSEFAAASEAEKLEKILREALETRSSSIVAFCRQHIYPMYELACEDGFVPENKELKRIYAGCPLTDTRGSNAD